MVVAHAGQKAEINMTPMIDVLLVLIIIFMVITPLRPTGLGTLIPEPAANQDAVRPHDLVITVARDGAIRLNSQNLGAAELPYRLSGLFRTVGDQVIFVRGDKGLEFRTIAAVIDAVKGAGFERIALMTN